MKTPSFQFRGVALGAAVMISLCTGVVPRVALAQQIVPAPPGPGDTVIVVPPGTQPVQVQPVPEPKKRQGFFDRLFGDDEDDERPRARAEDTPDNDDDGDTTARRAPKAEIVIEEAPPGPPVAQQPKIQEQPGARPEIRKEPAKKSTRRSNNSTKVEVAPAPPKTRMELAPPESTATAETTRSQTQVAPSDPAVITDRTTHIQKPPTIREMPASRTVTRSVTSTSPLPSDQAVLEKARAKTQLEKTLEANKQAELEVTQEPRTVPAPAAAVTEPASVSTATETHSATVEETPAPPVKVVEQQRALTETKEELTRLKDEVATVKEELENTKRASPPVDVDKVTIAAPNEATPIAAPEPGDAAATPPARAGSVAGSEAPTDKAVVKPSEPPADTAASSSPPASANSDAVTIGTTAAKESGAPASSPSEPPAGLGTNDGVPVGTKTDSPDFVRSPFPPHNKLDVTGMKPGSLAKDPSNGKVFRVP